MNRELTLKEIEELVAPLPGDFVVYLIKRDERAMKILHFKKNILASFGVSEADFLKSTEANALDVVFPADRQLVLDSLSCRDPQNSDIDCVFRLLHRKKGFFWVHARSALIGTMGGYPVLLTNYLNTDFETEPYAGVLDHSNLRVAIIDRQTHEILYANRLAREHAYPACSCREGRKCYEYIRGFDAPCRHCLMNTDQRVSEYRDENRGRWMRVTTANINWCGRAACAHYIEDVTEARDAEAKLAESQKKYQAATEGAELLVFEYDVRARAIICPSYAAAKFGIPRRIENVPDSLLFQFDKKDHERFRNFFRRVEAGEPRVCDDFWMVNTSESSPVCMRFVYTTVMDGEGRPLKAYALARNITAEKKDAEQYEASLRKLLFSNRRSLGSFHLNLTQNSCGEGQSSSKLILALQKDGTADGFFKAIAAMLADRDSQQFFVQRMNCAALLADFRAGRTYHSLDLRFRLSSGGSLWVNGNVQMIENPASKDVEAVAYSYDISDRKKEEAVIQKITNDEYDFIALIDPAADEIEFRSVKDDQAFARLRGKHGYSEFTRRVLKEVVAPEELDSFLTSIRLENLTAWLDENGSYLLACTTCGSTGLHRKQARYSWLDEAHEKILLIQTDVTQLYEQEQAHMHEVETALLEAEKANEAKSSFMSSISHDMRTPLNGIIGFTDLALKTDSAAAVRDYLEKIRISGGLLLDLINDTLTLSKIDSGKLAIDCKTEDIFKLINIIAVPIRAAAEAKGVRFVLDASGVKCRWVRADRKNIQKIFLNLLGNAVKFTPAGGTVQYVIREVQNDGGEPNIFVTVRDDGIGIGDKFLPHIYEPFAQERAGQPGSQGTGLGLAIVKRLITLMGGTIKVKSQRGRGTEFTVSMRLEPAAAPDKHGGEAQTRGSRTDLSGARLLICEDNDLNMEIARTLLESAGAVVVCAVNGREGLEKFAASRLYGFSAILMDVRMPVMNGLEAAAAIRALPRIDAPTVPIIAMSADAYDEDIRKCLAAGMNAHVAKPVNPKQLLETINAQRD